MCAARKGHEWGIPGCGMMHVAAWRNAVAEVLAPAPDGGCGARCGACRHQHHWQVERGGESKGKGDGLETPPRQSELLDNALEAPASSAEDAPGEGSEGQRGLSEGSAGGASSRGGADAERAEPERGGAGGRATSPDALGEQGQQPGRRRGAARGRVVGVLWGGATGASDEEDALSVDGRVDQLARSQPASPGSAAAEDAAGAGDAAGAARGCGALFAYDAGAFVLREVQPGTSAARHNARAAREGSFAQELRAGDRLTAVDDAPCAPGSAAAEVSPLRPRRRLLGWRG